MTPFTIVGVDPGKKNPGVAELMRNDYGWNVVSMPKLANDIELVAWFEERMRNPPVNLKLVSFEDVRNIGAWLNKKTQQGFGAAQILECIGMARLFAKFHGVPCAPVATNTMRKEVLGTGEGTKEQMAMMLSKSVRFWPTPCSLNQSDSAAVAIAGYRSQKGVPVEWLRGRRA